MEEEGARRRKYRGTGVGVHRFLEGLNEDAEDEEGTGSNNIPRAARQVEALTNHNTAQDLSSRHHKADRKRHSPKGFELDMDGATLLGRRHRRNAGVIASSALPSLQGNGSPLKLESLRIDD
jgi:serine/threonine-protein kinase RCK2